MKHITQRTIVLALLLTSALSPILLAGEAGDQTPASSMTLSFNDVFRKILNHYPLIKKEEARHDAAVAQKWTALAHLFPFVRGESGVTTGNDPVYVFGSLLKQGAFQQGNFSIPALNDPRHRTNFNFALEGEVPIFQGFQTISSIRSASFTVKAIQNEREFVIQEAALVALEAYLRVILSDALYVAASEVNGKIEADLQQAEELKDKGLVLGADFYASKLIQSVTEQMTNKFAAAKKESRMMVNVLSGDEPDQDFALRGSLSDDEFVLKPASAWVGEAFERRKDLQGIQWMIRAKEAELTKSKTSFLPKLAAFGKIEESSHDLRTGGEDYLIGFKGTMDILDPSLVARIKNSRAGLDELKSDEMQLADQIKKSVFEKALTLEEQNKNALVALEGSKNAEEAVKQTEKLYQEGRKSIADLSEIRRAHLESVIHQLELFYNREISCAGLYFVSGNLSEETLKLFENRMKGS